MDGLAKNERKPAKGDRSALRHGLKAGQLPADCKYIEVRLNDFRRRLEDAVEALRGEIPLPDAATIQTCLRWERHAALAQRELVKAGDQMKPVERLNCSYQIARASAERDKAIAALRLGSDSKMAAIEALYSRPRVTDVGGTEDEPS